MFFIIVKRNIVIFSVYGMVMFEEKIMFDKGIVIFLVFEWLFFGVCEVVSLVVLLVVMIMM